MATTNVDLKQRRDTTTNWNNYNPVLPDGEIGYDKDRNIIKIGNGTDPWLDRPSVGVESLINVVDYGADPTGTEDSYDAIVAALNVSNNIYFPDGNYVINSTLEIPGSVHVKGSNKRGSKIIGKVRPKGQYIVIEDLYITDLDIFYAWFSDFRNLVVDDFKIHADNTGFGSYWSIYQAIKISNDAILHPEFSSINENTFIQVRFQGGIKIEAGDGTCNSNTFIGCDFTSGGMINNAGKGNENLFLGCYIEGGSNPIVGPHDIIGGSLNYEVALYNWESIVAALKKDNTYSNSNYFPMQTPHTLEVKNGFIKGFTRSKTSLNISYHTSDHPEISNKYMLVTGNDTWLSFDYAKPYARMYVVVYSGDEIVSASAFYGGQSNYHIKNIDLYDDLKMLIVISDSLSDSKLSVRLTTSTASQKTIKIYAMGAYVAPTFTPPFPTTFKFVDTTAPTAGTWEIGETIYNSTPTKDGNDKINLGWICTNGGTPGTWENMYVSAT